MSFKNAKAYQISAKTFTLPSLDLLNKNTNYYWRVKNINKHSTSPWSEIFSFSTGDEDWKKVTLLNPDNGALIFPSATFSWTDIKNDEYLVQVSEDPDFSKLMFEGTTTNTSTSIDLLPAKRYYWRVQPKADYGLWSEPKQFNTILPEIKLISPADSSKNIDLSSAFEWNNVNSAVDYTLAPTRH